jgi:hypothetical protein
MAQYRIYTFRTDGSISSQPRFVECGDDEEAIGQARKVLKGEDIELWQGTRFVIRLDHTERAWDAAALLRRLRGRRRKYQA